MSQNTSSVVMQQRIEPKRSLDDFPTPPWATRALCETLVARGHRLAVEAVREPAANRAFMVCPLHEYFAEVKASDIADYGYAGRSRISFPRTRSSRWTGR
jgi:hypothetical protein